MGGNLDLRPIFVVEDDEDDVFIFSRRITATGVANPIVVFRSPEEAIKYLNEIANGSEAQTKPCVIFSDGSFPGGGSGHELLRWIRARPGFAASRIYLVTGSENRAHRDQASALGANGYLMKHPITSEIARIVRDACGDRQQQEAVGHRADN